MKKIAIFLLFAIFLAPSCELYDNIDPKSPSAVPAENLFSNAQLNLANVVDEPNVNVNTTRLLVQHWQQTTYFDESRYQFLDRGIPDNFSSAFYLGVLRDLKQAKTQLLALELGGQLAAERNNKVAIAGILEAYAWQCLVDAFGNVPYTQALRGEESAEFETPAYDDAKTIYMDVISNLQTDLSALDESAASYGDNDFMYGGDITAWKKFGASLLLRFGMRMTDADAGMAQSLVESAVSMGVITTAEETGALTYTGVVPHVNGIYDHYNVQNRADYVPANTIIDMMIAHNDPRLALWFTQATDADGNPAYIGGIAGLDGAQSYPNFSHFSATFFDPSLPAVLINDVEVHFLLAEAVERGFGVGGTAEEHYNAAIKSSIMSWGGSEADADAYLMQESVAYSSAPGDFKQKIGTQKWLGLYNRGLEAWTEWRRLDHPALSIPEGLTADDVPKRMPYPFNEGELNGDNYSAAASAIGGDRVQTRIFWDMN